MHTTGYSVEEDLQKGMPNFAAVHPAIIDDANMRAQKPNEMLDEGRMLRAQRAVRLMNQAATMQKAILIIAQKKGITRQIPDDEVGTSDLPQGKLKYDHVPDIANMVGAGGAGRVECTAPFRTGGGMLSNTVMGQEITRSMADDLNRVKKGKLAPNHKKEKLIKASIALLQFRREKTNG